MGPTRSHISLSDIIFRFSSLESTIPRARTFRRLKVLTRREARVLHAVADTIFPADANGMPSVEEAQVVQYLDDILSRLELKERILIRSLLALLEVQTLVFNGSNPCLFTQATPEERTKNLAGWESSRIFQRRLVFMAIRTLLLWAYADSQEVEATMGFVAGTTRTKERQDAAIKAARRAIEEARGVTPPQAAVSAPPSAAASPSETPSSSAAPSSAYDASAASSSGAIDQA